MPLVSDEAVGPMPGLLRQIAESARLGLRMGSMATWTPWTNGRDGTVTQLPNVVADAMGGIGGHNAALL